VFLDNNPDNDFVAIHPPAAPGMNQADISNSRWSSLGWNIVVITRSAEHPERIFELLDFINSHEGQVLNYYGPQGELWDELDGEGVPILITQPTDLSPEEMDRIGADIRWNKVGNTGISGLMGNAIRNRTPREEWPWHVRAQQEIIYEHSRNADEFLNINPDPLEAAGIAQSAFWDLNDQQVPRIVTAANPDAARAALQDAIAAFYAQDFASYEAYATPIFHANLALMGS